MLAGLDELPASDAAVSAIEGGAVSDASARDGADVRPPTVCDVEPSWGPGPVVGAPSWQTAELAVFGAPIGATSNDIFTQTTNAVFGPNHAYDPVSNVTRAFTPHAGPYDRELEAGILRAGFRSTGCLRLSELAAPNGFAIAMNLVPSPTAAVRKSFESPTAGPVVSFGALNIAADLYIDGVLVDPHLDNEFPSAAEVYFDPTIEGYAHLFLIFSESTTYAPLTVGLYRFDVSLDDGVGNRTFNSLTFKVVD